MCVIYYKVFLLPTLSVIGIMTSETHCPQEHSPHTELSSLKAISCAGVALLKEYYFLFEKRQTIYENPQFQ